MARSEIRAFKKNGFTAAGNVLPLSEMKLFIDYKNPTVDKTRGDYVVSKAEEYLEKDIPMIPLSLYRDKFLTGVRSRYENVYNVRRDCAYYCTLAEVYERRGRFINKIADAVWAMLEETSWCLPAHQYTSRTHPEYQLPEAQDGDSLAGLDLQTSQTAATLATVRYFFKDELDAISPSICKRIDKLIYLRAVRPLVTGNYWWDGSSAKGTVCNWCTNITSNILYAGALTQEDMEVRVSLLNRAMYNFDNFIASYPEDGTCSEGPAYWGAAPGNLFDGLEIIEDMTGGKITVYDEPIIRNMGSFCVNMNVHEDWYVCFADCGSKLHHSGDVVERYGRKCKSPALEAFGHKNAYGAAESYYFYGMAYRFLKNYHTPIVTEITKTNADRAVWMDGHKIAVFRESEDTSKGLFLATKGGTNSEPGNHNDIGCLVIFSNGKPVIIDPAIGSYNNEYFGKTRYERWYTNASYHSCPTFDGIDQRTGGVDGVPYSSADEVCDLDKRCVSMNLAGAYPAEAGVLLFNRTSKLEDGRITVTDTFKLDRERVIDLHLTSHAEPKPLGEGRVELADGRVLSYNKDLELIIEKIENTKPFEDLNFKYMWGTECLWRVVLRVTAKEYEAKLVIE